MDKRELKKRCYLEALDDSLIHVEKVLNYLNKIEEKKGIFDEDILFKDYTKAVLDLELSLADLCIVLRKMSENQYIVLGDELRRDVNSLIHSNRFDYEEDIYVYSQRGKEKVDLRGLLGFCKKLLFFDKIRS